MRKITKERKPVKSHLNTKISRQLTQIRGQKRKSNCHIRKKTQVETVREKKKLTVKTGSSKTFKTLTDRVSKMLKSVGKESTLIS